MTGAIMTMDSSSDTQCCIDGGMTIHMGVKCWAKLTIPTGVMALTF
jgi:hypothetical protein